MYLLIDTTEDDVITLHYTMNSEWKVFLFPANHEGSLLAAIDALLTDQGVVVTAINGVAARVGKGKFTATRLTATVANTLAYSLSIPVVAFTELDFDQIRERLEQTPLGQYATALYSAPASVGRKS